MGVLPSDAHFDPYNGTYFSIDCNRNLSHVLKSIDLTEESSLLLFEINLFLLLLF